jgi:hypothetical protein
MMISIEAIGIGRNTFTEMMDHGSANLTSPVDSGEERKSSSNGQRLQRRKFAHSGSNASWRFGCPTRERGRGEPR